MTLEQFLGMLEGVRKSGERFTARCPAHPDKRSSLSIKAGEKWVLTRCFAGCTTQDICDALGIKVTELAFDKPRHLSGNLADDLLDTASMFIDLATRHEALSVTERAKLVSAAAKRLRRGEGS